MRLLFTTVAILGMGLSTAYAYDNDRPIQPPPSDNACPDALSFFGAGMVKAAGCILVMFGQPEVVANPNNGANQPQAQPSEPSVNNLP